MDSEKIPTSILAIDLGGTKILLGEVTPDGEVLNSKSYPSDTTTQAIALEHIIRAIHDYKETVPFIAKEQIAIGIGLVGRVDHERGVWLEIEPGKSHDTAVKQIIEQAFSLPCGIDNDVACATKSELTFGWGASSHNFLYLNVGTGIAAGFVVNKEYITGSHFNAGEIGHMVVAMDSDVLCGCGRKGCVERLASGLGLHERIIALQHDYYPTSLIIEEGKRVSADSIFEAAESGDELCVRVSEEAAQALASTIMNLVRVSDPDTIILGGGVTNNMYFLNRIKHYLNPRTMRFVTNGLVFPKHSPTESGLIGAALAGLEASKSKSQR
ncbi:ROK family protein [Paenibacillus segetis]|uniref:Sugar kinase n=1 Tax=Paenibacillus segetis TaxID=1325360 RepID=A0ABQ1YNI0_9BACL|nr:ROK family protein [Paenibacillus segetis]GGH30648.1 sugar kinase [Paenibacillus segetis]